MSRDTAIKIQELESALAFLQDDLEDNLGQQEELRSVERSLRKDILEMEDAIEELKD